MLKARRSTKHRCFLYNHCVRVEREGGGGYYPPLEHGCGQCEMTSSEALALSWMLSSLESDMSCVFRGSAEGKTEGVKGGQIHTQDGVWNRKLHIVLCVCCMTYRFLHSWIYELFVIICAVCGVLSFLYYYWNSALKLLILKSINSNPSPEATSQMMIWKNKLHNMRSFKRHLQECLWPSWSLVAPLLFCYVSKAVSAECMKCPAFTLLQVLLQGHYSNIFLYRTIMNSFSLLFEWTCWMLCV